VITIFKRKIIVILTVGGGGVHVIGPGKGAGAEIPRVLHRQDLFHDRGSPFSLSGEPGDYVRWFLNHAAAILADIRKTQCDPDGGPLCCCRPHFRMGSIRIPGMKKFFVFKVRFRKAFYNEAINERKAVLPK
jgi:hypothetical protein